MCWAGILVGQVSNLHERIKIAYKTLARRKFCRRGNYAKEEYFARRVIFARMTILHGLRFF